MGAWFSPHEEDAEVESGVDSDGPLEVPDSAVLLEVP